MLNWSTLAGDIAWADENQRHPYNDLAYQILFDFEQDPNNPHWDSRGNATIGVGFNLDDPVVFNAVMDVLELTSTNTRNFRAEVGNEISRLAGLWSNTNSPSFDTVHAIVAAALDAGAANRSSLTVSQEEMRPLFYDIVGRNSYENNIDRWVAGIPASRERAVLFSLSYNQSYLSESGENVALLGTGLKHAILGNQAKNIKPSRAEAWFEIRYNSNRGSIPRPAGGDHRGFAKRRYMEAHLFGLYDDLSANTSDITDKESLDVFRMFNAHENKIRLYDLEYSEMIDWVRRDMIKTRVNSGDPYIFYLEYRALSV